MLARQKVFAVLVSIGLIILIVELIRRRKLREEYAILWFGVSIGVLILVLYYPLLELLSRLIGAITPTTTLFLFGYFFLMMITIHFSVKFSKQAEQIKILTQEIAYLRFELEEFKVLKGEAVKGTRDSKKP